MFFVPETPIPSPFNAHVDNLCISSTSNNSAVHHHPSKSLMNMSEITYQRVAGPEMTGLMLEEASALFSDHYGIWGKAGKAFTTPGLYIDISI